LWGSRGTGLLATVVSTGWLWWALSMRFGAPGGTPRQWFATAVLAATGLLFTWFNDRRRQSDRRLLHARHDQDALPSSASARICARRWRSSSGRSSGTCRHRAHSTPTSVTISRIVERNARTILRYVDDLLDVMRVDAGRATVEYDEVDAAALVRATVRSVRRTGERARHPADDRIAGGS
jgi:signal transduction histidine kinase